MRSEKARRRPVYRPAAYLAARTGSPSIPLSIYLLLIPTRDISRLANGALVQPEILGCSSGGSAWLWASTIRDSALPDSPFCHTP